MDFYQKLKTHPEIKSYLDFYLERTRKIQFEYPQESSLRRKCFEFIVEAYSKGDVKLEDFEKKLYEMMNLIDDLISAMTSFSDNFLNEHKKNKRAKKNGMKRDTNSEKKKFYSFEYLHDYIYSEDVNISNISISQLNYCISRYIKMDWFKLKEIELILADSYIRYCLKVNRENYLREKYGLLISACLFIGAHSRDSFALKSYFWIGIKVILFGMIFQNIYKLISTDHVTTAFGWVAGIIFYFGFKISVFFQNRKTRKIVDILFSAHKLLHSNIWEPNKLLILAEEIEKLDIQTPELVPLAKKICDQSVNIF